MGGKAARNDGVKKVTSVKSEMDNGVVQNITIRQLKIDDEQFQRLMHSLKKVGSAQAVAGIVKDEGGDVMSLIFEDGKLLLKKSEISAKQLKEDYSWQDERMMFGASRVSAVEKKRGEDKLVESTTKKLTVSSYNTDDLALVHHTEDSDKEESAHLTVENAHISALLHIREKKTLEGFEKGGKVGYSFEDKKKPFFEEDMKKNDLIPVDNLNFFPKSKKTVKEGGEPVYDDLTLDLYLKVIQNAMDNISNVPPVYGVEMMRSAHEIARLKKMDVTKLFLRVDNGDERHLFRAVMNMVKMQLLPLSLPEDIGYHFKEYANPEPALFKDGVRYDMRAVYEGNESFATMEKTLATQCMGSLIKYLQTVTA